MAGPWIKMEYATIKKVEITKIASKLGVSRREAFAMCFEFWCWCDAELVNGHIVGVGLDELDETVGLKKGFAAAMCHAKWLIHEKDRIIVVNFVRHLGKSAKTRANAAKRQSTARSKRPMSR